MTFYKADFLVLVKKMRDAQKRYFKLQTQQNLEVAKKLERQVDIMLEDIQVERVKAAQLKLNFDANHVHRELQGEYNARGEAIEEELARDG
jgi:hypothetical protein